MSWRKGKLLLLITIMNIFLLCGCWNYREIEKMGIAAGVAIDKNPQNGMYVLTVEIVSAGGKNTETIINSNLYSAEGSTIFEAIRKIRIKVGKKIFWSHSKVLIISKEIAAQGVIPILDWFNRDPEPRATMWVFVSTHETARELFKYKVESERVTSFHLDEVMDNQKVSNRFVKTDLKTFVNDITSDTEGAIVPTISVTMNENVPALQVEGTAVFKKDKSIGYLSGNETVSMLFIKGKIERGMIMVQNLGGGNSNVTLEIFGNKTKMTAAYEEKKVKMNITVKTEVAIGEISTSKDVMEEKSREALKKEAELRLKKQLEFVIQKVQKELKVDVFGFGRRIEIDHSNLWKEIKPNWQEVFSYLNYDINVDITIKGSGKTLKPIEKIE